MEQKSYPKNTERFAEKEQKHIHEHGVIRVQRVKLNATSVGLENGAGEQMVEVHQHRGQQNQVHFFPLFTKKHPRDDQGKHKM